MSFKKEHDIKDELVEKAILENVSGGQQKDNCICNGGCENLCIVDADVCTMQIP